MYIQMKVNIVFFNSKSIIPQVADIYLDSNTTYHCNSKKNLGVIFHPNGLLIIIFQLLLSPVFAA